MTQFVLAILISIAVLIFMIVKLNIHPVISLFIGSMIAGSILGKDRLPPLRPSPMASAARWAASA